LGFHSFDAGDDGDPLDVMIMHEASTSPGLILRCNVIGALIIVQSDKNKKTRNDRLVAAPTHSHLERHLKTARGLPAETWDELENFFTATDELQDKKLEFEGWVGPKHTLRLLKEAEKAVFKTCEMSLRDGCPRSNFVRMVRTIVSALVHFQAPAGRPLVLKFR
jgi:inorganic pyrophosphatase